jgi:hypothetical protein
MPLNVSKAGPKSKMSPTKQEGVHLHDATRALWRETARAEAGRILLAATGRQGIPSDDKAYLARLVAARTGIAQPDAERRVEDAITAATTAVQKARRSAVILGFATAASLLAGAAAAWYAASAGGRHRDNAALSPTWWWPQRA